MPRCIFVNKPSECSVCIECIMKIQCALNHPYLKLTNIGQLELIKYIQDVINSPDRIK
jgi:hypothetical protein